MSDTIVYPQITVISIPDLNENPYIIQDVILNNKTYYFEYFWNIRHNKAYLSIYILIDNEKVYLIRNKQLTILINLTKYIDMSNDYWAGNLYFCSKDVSNICDYNQQNIYTDYQIIYWT